MMHGFCSSVNIQFWQCSSVLSDAHARSKEALQTRNVIYLLLSICQPCYKIRVLMCTFHNLTTWLVDSSRRWTWLRVPERVQYKLQDRRSGLWSLPRLASAYIGPLNHVVDLPGRRPLLSAGTNRLAVLPVKSTIIAFPTWNDLL